MSIGTRIKAIAGAILAGGMIAGGIILGTGDTSGTVDAGSQPATDARMARAIRIQGECPANDKPSKEPAKCVSTTQMDGWCLCITEQPSATVDNEVAAASDIAPAKRQRMVVCDGGGRDAGTVVRWEASASPVGAGCQVVIDNALMPNISMSAIETDIEAQLREVCAPCRVTAGSWGPCPHCLRWPGGCAEACRE